MAIAGYEVVPWKGQDVPVSLPSKESANKLTKVSETDDANC